MSTSRKNGTDDKFVKIYMLTKLTDAEEEKFLAALRAPAPSGNLGWVKPELVRWGSDADGTARDDLLRLYKKHTAEEGKNPSGFCFFADRRSVEEGGTIVAGADWERASSEEVGGRLVLEMADKHGVELLGRDGEALARLQWDLSFELAAREVSWGRVPAQTWKTDWANLDVVEMSLAEIIRSRGSEVQVLVDPEWDAESFVKRLKEVRGNTGEWVDSEMLN